MGRKAHNLLAISKNRNTKTMTVATDQTIMPWGKHRGVKLANIPADYLIWLYENSEIKTQHHNLWLADYIRKNLDVLKAEIKRNTASQRR
jgi:hypothetical protein